MADASPSDLAAIEEILLRLSEMVCNHPEISELDINPLIVHAEGLGAFGGRQPDHAAQARGEVRAGDRAGVGPAQTGRQSLCRHQEEETAEVYTPADASLEAWPRGSGLEGRIGHFHFAKIRTFSCCVDNDVNVIDIVPLPGISSIHDGRHGIATEGFGMRPA